MRLQLIAAVVVGVVGAASAGAEPTSVSANARTALYADTDATQIVTSIVAAGADVAGRVRVDAHYLVDAVSTASVDVVSAATGRFEDTRHEAGGGLTYHDAAGSLGLAYVRSTENDWSSHAGRATWARDVLDHQLTLGLGAGLIVNRVGKREDPSFDRSLTEVNTEVSAVLALSPRDLCAASYGLAVLDGFQASPYRFLLVGRRRAFFERLPELRVRHALTLRWNHHLGADTALRAHLRGYADSWGVRSLTGGAEVVVGVRGIDVAAEVRGYGQLRADFYRPVYLHEEAAMTADRELATFADVFVAASAATTRALPFGELRLDARLALFDFWFEDVPRLSARAGVVFEVGVALSR